MADSLLEVQRSLCDRTLRAVELAEQSLAAMKLDAYRSIERERTLSLARAADAAFDAGIVTGALQGIPVSVKDLYGVPGFPTYAGSGQRLPARYEAAGTVVRRLMQQLGVVVGKTHTVEFAFGGIGTNPHYPTPQNPWDAAELRVPGGSSAGAGVSLCEGSALVALGTDTAGSVRIPAAWTGNVALKTTKGRWPTDGIVPLSSTLDTAGLLARTIEDLAVAAAALDPTLTVPPRVTLPGLRLGRCDTPFFEDCAPGVAEAVDGALAELAAAGASLVHFDLPEATGALALFGVGGPVSAELHFFLSTELPEWLEDLDPNVQARIGDAGSMPTTEYLRRLRTISALAASSSARLREIDVLVTPTVANSPPKAADVADGDRYRRENVLCLRNTAVVSYLGLCAVTLPVGKDAAGMPVGMQLVARAGDEANLLAVARAVEAQLGVHLGPAPRLG